MVFILLHSLLSVGDVYGVGEPEFGPSGNSKKNEIPPADDRSIDVFRSKTGKTVYLARLRLKGWSLFRKVKGGYG
jgi:hypothetical protein